MNMNESFTPAIIISICPQGERHCPDVPGKHQSGRFVEAREFWGM